MIAFRTHTLAGIPRWFYALTLLALGATPGSVLGQVPPELGDSVITIVPNEDLTAGSLRRALWGDQYRDTWASPIQVSVLELRSFASGLTPVRKGSEDGPRMLVFAGADGRRFVFRSLEPNLRYILPRFLLETVGKEVTHMVTAAQYPGAPLVIWGLPVGGNPASMEPRLFVLPDDPILGEYREDFAGLVGLLAELATDSASAQTIGGSAVRLIDSDHLFELVQASPGDRVDSRAYLTERLFDVLVSDWAQPRPQWAWARRDADSTWLPIPMDRSQAFTRRDGFVPSKAWHFDPILVAFREKYPHMFGLHLSAEELDRHFLADLAWESWDSVAEEITVALSDSVIEAAVSRLPPPWYTLDGAYLSRILKARRDALPAATRDFYLLLAGEAAVYGTDVAEDVSIAETGDGQIEVTISERSPGSRPFYRRLFRPEDTKEIRIYLLGGDDRVAVRGRTKLPLTVRLVGGAGDDELRYETPTTGVRFYDATGNNQVTGDRPRGLRIDETPYDEWTYSADGPLPPRTTGVRTIPTAQIGLSADYGLFLGAGARREHYGFRKDPYADKLFLFGGLSTQGRIDLEFDADVRRENSARHLLVKAFVSQIHVLHWYGLGNDTERDSTDNQYYQVNNTWVGLEPAAALSIGQHGTISLGPDFIFSIEGDNAGKFIGGETDLYGRGDFAHLGAFLEYRLDSRDVKAAARKGATLKVRGAVWPAILDVEDLYGSMEVVGTTYLTPAFARRATLALRAGGRTVWGRYPWFNAAFVGGRETLRGWDINRYAGDSSLYGNASLRLFIAHIPKLLPGDLGIFGLADIGRVWLDGESTGGWHAGYGGGVSYAFVSRASTMSAAIATGREQTTIYVNFGFEF